MNGQTIYGWVLIVIGVLALISDGFQDSTTMLGVIMLISSGWVIIDSQAKINNLEIDVLNLNDENFDLEEELIEARK